MGYSYKFMLQIYNILTEEPDTGILYVRICGGISGVIHYSIPISGKQKKHPTKLQIDIMISYF